RSDIAKDHSWLGKIRYSRDQRSQFGHRTVRRSWDRRTLRSRSASVRSSIEVVDFNGRAARRTTSSAEEPSTAQVPLPCGDGILWSNQGGAMRKDMEGGSRERRRKAREIRGGRQAT